VVFRHLYRHIEGLVLWRNGEFFGFASEHCHLPVSGLERSDSLVERSGLEEHWARDVQDKAPSWKIVDALRREEMVDRGVAWHGK